MRLTILLILICFLPSNTFGQKRIEAILKTVDGNSFYSISENTNKKTIIFLHGGVNNPFFDQTTNKITLDYLFENNQNFLAQAALNRFNVIVPITNDRLNWIDNPRKSFQELKKMLGQATDEHEEIYISGFSDGGTGSFKIFYNNLDYFDGLVVFNGYPQHENFYKTVDYETVENKKILFLSTFKDKIIPYEFLITEYCAQKKTNPNTFLYLSPGGHSFSNYTEDDIKKVFDILIGKNQNELTEPIQGFIKNDQLVTLYPFRKKMVRKYSFMKDVYEANLAQHKE